MVDAGRVYPPFVWSLTFGLAFVILVLRRTATVFVAEFWADDGPIYTDALRRGVATLLEPWGGSQVLVQRAIVLVKSWVRPYWAPVVGNVLALSITALVATFLATRLPVDGRRRMAIAGAFVLLPGNIDVLGSVSTSNG